MENDPKPYKFMKESIKKQPPDWKKIVLLIAGWLILGQTLSARELTGCAIVFLAIVLAQLPWPPTKKS